MILALIPLITALATPVVNLLVKKQEAIPEKPGEEKKDSILALFSAIWDVLEDHGFVTEKYENTYKNVICPMLDGMIEAAVAKMKAKKAA